MSELRRLHSRKVADGVMQGEPNENLHYLLPRIALA